MIFAVNTRFLIKNRLEGIGWFTFETLRRIVQQHPEHRFFFLFDRQPDPEFIFAPNVTPVVLHPQARHPLLWHIWFQFSVKRFLKRNRVDAFISTDGFIPLHCSIPSLSVIHDINFEHYPEGIPALTRWFYRRYFPKFARLATRVATVSLYSKTDLVETYGIDSEKIDVVHNGANENFKPLNAHEAETARQQFAQGNPYFVFVGALNPRKNVARLIRAFDRFVNETQLPHQLVIVGERMFRTADINEALAQISHASRVHFTGRLQVQDLQLALGGATAMAFVSYFEGFGIPALESMYCHVPVVASNRTSIPEVTGEAAYYVDPFSEESIAKGLRMVATDPRLHEALVAASAKQKELFSWNRAAEKLYHSILKTVGQA